jgi:hypothetical protein
VEVVYGHHGIDDRKRATLLVNVQLSNRTLMIPVWTEPNWSALGKCNHHYHGAKESPLNVADMTAPKATKDKQSSTLLVQVTFERPFSSCKPALLSP